MTTKNVYLKQNPGLECVFLSIATNIPQRLKTGFVVQGHIYWILVSF